MLRGVFMVKRKQLIIAVLLSVIVTAILTFTITNLVSFTIGSRVISIKRRL